MATRGVSMYVQYLAWNTSQNRGQTGDAANHTLKWIKDGDAVSPTNSPEEIDAAGAPGVYRLLLTASETDANLGTISGVSSTANVQIIPTKVEFERLPDAAPGGAGGVALADADGQVAIDMEQSLPANPPTDTVGGALKAVGKISRYTPNAVEVDHNYGGPDNYSYLTTDGRGIDNATVIAYLKSDYDAGNRDESYYKDAVLTDVNGQWTQPMLLDPGEYVLYFYKQGEYGPDTADLTVT